MEVPSVLPLYSRILTFISSPCLLMAAECLHSTHSYSALALEETDFEDFCVAVLMLGVSGKKPTFNFSQLSLEKSSLEDYPVSPAIWEKSVISMGRKE